MVSKNRDYLAKLIIEALEHNNGSASIADICKYIWDNYKDDLRKKGNLFYKWQYEMRWSADHLTEQGIITRKSGNWKLK